MSHHDTERDFIFAHELPATPLQDGMIPSTEGKIKVSLIGLCGCWGCTLSLLDLDERLFPLLDKITILRSSITDIKRIPERCTVGFIEGGVANAENIETLEHFRANCDILISVGACACWGGVPAIRNMLPLKECLAEAYINAPSNAKLAQGAHPVIPLHPEIPLLTDKVYPCHEVVKMDYFIPGCPPDGDAVFQVLDDLINGRTIDLPTSIHPLHRYD